MSHTVTVRLGGRELAVDASSSDASPPPANASTVTLAHLRSVRFSGPVTVSALDGPGEFVSTLDARRCQGADAPRPGFDDLRRVAEAQGAAAAVSAAAASCRSSGIDESSTATAAHALAVFGCPAEQRLKLVAGTGHSEVVATEAMAAVFCGELSYADASALLAGLPKGRDGRKVSLPEERVLELSLATQVYRGGPEFAERLASAAQGDKTVMQAVAATSSVGFRREVATGARFASATEFRVTAVQCLDPLDPCLVGVLDDPSVEVRRAALQVCGDRAALRARFEALDEASDLTDPDWEALLQNENLSDPDLVRRAIRLPHQHATVPLDAVRDAPASFWEETSGLAGHLDLTGRRQEAMAVREGIAGNSDAPWGLREDAIIAGAVVDRTFSVKFSVEQASSLLCRVVDELDGVLHWPAEEYVPSAADEADLEAHLEHLLDVASAAAERCGADAATRALRCTPLRSARRMARLVPTVSDVAVLCAAAVAPKSAGWHEQDLAAAARERLGALGAGGDPVAQIAAVLAEGWSGSADELAATARRVADAG